MLEQHGIAITAVLAYIDQRSPQCITCTSRLKCLKKIHARLPKECRRVLHDFNSISGLLQRVLHDPNHLQNKNDAQLESRMQRLFKEGSSMFEQTFLDSIVHHISPNPKENANGKLQHQPCDQSCLGKRPLPSDPLDDNPSTPKSVKLNATTPPDGETESQHTIWFDSTSTESLIRRLFKATTTPPSNSASASFARHCGIDDFDNMDIEEAFIRIDELVEAIPSHAFANHQGSRIAQLTTKPIPDLEKLYVHAFGTKTWKTIAIRLQSTNVLVAKDFLKCIIWSFIVLNVFHLPELARTASNTALRDIDVHPEPSALAETLMRVLEAHLPQPLERHAIPVLRRSTRNVCWASWLLRERMSSVEKEYHITWYTNGAGYPFVEVDMERSPHDHGSRVAFTVMPGLSGKPQGRDLTWQAAVKTAGTS